MDINRILKDGEKCTPNEYSPLALAFIGDAVYESFVRAKVLLKANTSANKLHKNAVGFVNCNAQAEVILALSDKLSEEEQAVFKRGRNAKCATVPKNADIKTYHLATGFEALIGWLYLSGRTDRLYYIMDFAYNFILEEEH